MRRAWLAGLLLALAAVWTGSATATPGGGTARGWSLQSPLPTGFDLVAVDMPTASDVWAVGRDPAGAGVVIHSGDGGATWQPQAAGVVAPQAVWFLDRLHGWVVGDGAWSTGDGGATWVAGSGAGTGLTGVAFADTSTGFAATGGAALARTTDGGATWRRVAVAIPVSRVQFFDSSNGVATGSGGVLHTSDGGRAWSAVRSTHGGVFVDPLRGWDVQQDISWRTLDGGATWTAQNQIPVNTWSIGSDFVDAANGWAVGLAQGIIHTANGGATFVTQNGGLSTSPTNRYTLRAVSFADPLHGVAVGNAGTIFSTGDGGATWVARESGSPVVPLRIRAIDTRRAWVAATDGTVLFTTNGGAFWSRVNLQPTQGCPTCSNVTDLDFLDASRGWAVVGGQATGASWIWQSADGGVSWQPVDESWSGPLAGVAAVDRRTIVAVSAGEDLILRSADGGATWAPVAHPAAPGGFGGVRFVPGTARGWAVGAGGKILRSDDGGATWTLQRDGSHRDALADVSFADAANGWAVGGSVLHTADGGATWTAQATGLTGAVSVDAVDGLTAWVGGLGALASTVDGGATWRRERPSGASFAALAFPASGAGWAGGADPAATGTGSVWARRGGAWGTVGP